MRYPKGHKKQTREQVLDEAARAFRAEGVADVSIGALMRRLGLTHGGFYTHFPSKDALVAAACIRALAQAADDLFPLGGDAGPDQRLAQAIRRYLSRAHRDAPDTGCLIPALAGEVVHESDEVRHGFTEALRLYVERIATVMAGEDEEPDPPVSPLLRRGDRTDRDPPCAVGGMPAERAGGSARSSQGGAACPTSEESGALAAEQGTAGLPPRSAPASGSPVAGHPPDTETFDRALVLVAGMAGVVLLARAVDDAELSDRLLLAGRRLYTETFAPEGTETSGKQASPA